MKCFFQKSAINTNMHLESSSFLQNNGKWLNFIRMNDFYLRNKFFDRVGRVIFYRTFDFFIVTIYIWIYIRSEDSNMIELFFIVFYISLRPFSYIRVYITVKAKQRKYYHKKTTAGLSISLLDRKKKVFFKYFP